jgi:hypothetical protein
MLCPANATPLTTDPVNWLIEFPICHQIYNLAFWVNLSLLVFLVIVVPAVWLWVVAPRHAFGRRSYIPREDFVQVPTGVATTAWQSSPPDYPATKATPIGPSPSIGGVGSRRVAVEVLDRLRSSRATHRRVERFRFVAQKRVRRHTSVDIDLPNEASPVPIGLFQKDLDDDTQVGLRNFSTNASDNISTPLLGRYANSLVVYHALIIWLEDILSLLAGTPTAATEDEREWLWSVVAASRQGAERSFRRVARLLKSWADLDDDLLLPDQGLKRLVSAAIRDKDFWSLLSLLASNWVILVELRARTEGSPQRVVVKMDFDDFLDPYSVRHGRVRYFLRGLGWLPSVVAIPNLTSIPAQSLHVEFETPEGVELDSFVLISKPLLNDSMEIDRQLTAHEAAIHMRAVEMYGDRLQVDFRSASDSEATRHPDLGHAYLPHPRLHHQISAFASVRNERSGPLLSAAAGSAMLLALTWIGSFHPLAAISGPDTLLFAIPGALTGLLLFRQHEFAIRLQRPLRWMLVAAVALALVALTVLSLARSELNSCTSTSGCAGYSEDQIDLFVTHAFQYLRWGATILASLIFTATGPIRGTPRNKGRD